MSKIRGILERFSKKFLSDKYFGSGLVPDEKDFDQAEKEIVELIEGLIPERRDSLFKGKEYQIWEDGWNAYREEILRRLEELKK